MASTLSLDPEITAQLEELAKDEGRSSADLVRDALRAYLARRRYLAALDEGIRAADAGNLVDGNEVEAWLSSW